MWLLTCGRVVGKPPCVYWDCRLEEETKDKTEDVRKCPLRLFLHLRGQQDSSDPHGEGGVIVIPIRNH